MIFGVPSNLMLERFGARRWLAWIMMVWGVLSASMMFIEGAASFYTLRFLLGVAEAGFFPGIVLYLTWWFPEEDRARALALFMTAISASYVVGGPSRAPCSSWTASPGSTAGNGCSCCEGLPAIALGFVTLRFLDERPRDAEWLPEDEREALAARMDAEQAAKEAEGLGGGVRDALRSGQVWLFAWLYFIILSAGFGLTFFVPDLVQERTGLSDFEVGALAAVPYASPPWRWSSLRGGPTGRGGGSST